MTKVWFITGSSRGLGRRLMEYALAQGDSVIATARDSSTLSDLAQLHGPQILTVSLDVQSYDSTVSAISAGVAQFGHIDIVVNNAGYADVDSVEDISMPTFRAQVETNLFGVVHVSKAVTPVLRAQGHGHIFQISSLGGRLGSPGLSAYQCSKWAVGGFSTCLAAELAPLGVKVTVLEPGGIRTDWSGSSMETRQPSDPYKQTVGAFSDMIRGYHGQEPSLPEKFGPIIDTLYASEEPPVRMLIGPDALQFAKQIADAQAKSDEKWKELSASSV